MNEYWEKPVLLLDFQHRDEANRPKRKASQRCISIFNSILAHWFLWPVLVLRSICTCSKLPFPPKPSVCLYLLAHTILVGEAELLREAELLSQAETSSAWTEGKGMKNVSDTAVFWPLFWGSCNTRVCHEVAYGVGQIFSEQRPLVL